MNILERLFVREEPTPSALEYLSRRLRGAQDRARDAEDELDRVRRAAISIIQRYGPEVEQEFLRKIGL